MWEQLHTELILEPPPNKVAFIQFMPRLVAIYIMPDHDVACFLMETGKGIHESTVTLIQLECYRRDHGVYPDTLFQLIPKYLEALPIDHSTGKSLIYKLKDGKPLLYGRGRDGDDDQGKEIDDWEEFGSDGDWVLYPREFIKRTANEEHSTQPSRSKPTPEPILQ